MKREFSAGGVVFKKEDRQILFLVRKSSGGADYRGSLGWTLPKGMIDEGENSEQAAIRETREEAGVEVKILKKLETIKYFYTNPEKEKIMKFVTFFVMEYVSDTPEGFGWETAEVAWMNIDDIKINMAYDLEKKLVEQVWKLLQSQE